MGIHISRDNAAPGASGPEGPSVAKAAQTETHPTTLPTQQEKSVCPDFFQFQTNMAKLSKTFGSRKGLYLQALGKSLHGMPAGARLNAGVAAAFAALASRRKQDSLSSLLLPGKAPHWGVIATAVGSSAAASTPSAATAEFKAALTTG